MSTSAIVMLIIGGVGLWGGCALSCIIFAKRSKNGFPDDKDEEQEQNAVLKVNYKYALRLKKLTMHIFLVGNKRVVQNGNELRILVQIRSEWVYDICITLYNAYRKRVL